MNWQFNPYVIPVIAAALLSLVLSYIGWRRRPARGALWFALMMLAIFWWSATFALEFLRTDLAGRVFFARLEYLGNNTTPAFFFIIALVYTDREHWLTPRTITLLFVIPVITILLTWTNEWHELIWMNLALETDEAMIRLQFERGPAYWGYTIYNYLLVAVGLFLLVRALFRPSSFYRRQVLSILLGSLIPIIANVLYQFGVTPPDVELTPIAFSLTGLITAWGMFRYRLFDIQPVARDRLFECLGDAVVVLDVRGRVVDLNPAALQVFDRQMKEAIGNPAAEFFSRWPDLVEQFRDVQETCVTVSREMDGSIHHFEIEISPLLDSRGGFSGRIILLHEITQYKQTEEALHNAHRQMTLLRRVEAELSRKLDLQYELMMALDVSLRLTMADAGFIALVDGDHVRVAHAIGHYPSDFDSRLRLSEEGIAGRVIRNRKPELVLDVHSDPDYITDIPETQAQMTFPLLSTKRFVGILSLETCAPERFSEDLFETLKLLAQRMAMAIDNALMYEERLRLVEELDAYAHTVAHDLKGPLSVIKGNAQLLQMDSVPEKIKIDSLLGIEIGTDKMVEIIDSLLMLAQARQLEAVNMQPLMMGHIVDSAALRTGRLAAERQADIRIANSWPAALGEAQWVEEVWANIISNAVKYGGDPPLVEAGADEPEDGMVRFWVKDNGKGLTPEQCQEIFVPFTRLDVKRAEGHGLGLSIVQRIVNKLGGEVGVESEVGKGSCFWFTLRSAEHN